jgi:hypothetical protein
MALVVAGGNCFAARFVKPDRVGVVGLSIIGSPLSTKPPQLPAAWLLQSSLVNYSKGAFLGQPKAAQSVDSVPLGTPPGGRIKAFVMADASQHLRVKAKLKELIERASSGAADDLRLADEMLAQARTKQLPSTQTEIGAGGELIDRENVGSHLVDTVAHPDYVTAEASRDRLGLASQLALRDLCDWKCASAP